MRSTPEAFFEHAHIAGAIRMICNEPAHNPTAVRMAGRAGQSMEEFTDRQALKMRVMLAHLRVKREGYISSCSKSPDYEPGAAQPPELRALYDLFVEDKDDASSTPTPCRPSKQPRANPFIYVRDLDDKADLISEDDEEEKIIVVATYFDGERVVCLHSGGTVNHATHYTKSDTGFAVAHFEDGMPWESEVLASFVTEDGALLRQTMTKRPAKVLKRPA